MEPVYMLIILWRWQSNPLGSTGELTEAGSWHGDNAYEGEFSRNWQIT